MVLEVDPGDEDKRVLDVVKQTTRGDLGEMVGEAACRYQQK
jgi:hypothetical protein